MRITECGEQPPSRQLRRGKPLWRGEKAGDQRSEGGLKSLADSSFQKVAGLFDFCGETFLIWKGEFVFARQNLVR
jgi:hypothetical protein